MSVTVVAEKDRHALDRAGLANRAEAERRCMVAAEGGGVIYAVSVLYGLVGHRNNILDSPSVIFSLRWVRGWWSG